MRPSIQAIAQIYGLFLCLLWVWPSDAPAEEVLWEKIAADLETTTVRAWPVSPISPALLLLRTSLQRYRIGVVKAADFNLTVGNARRLGELSKAIAIINANFFDEKSKPLGLVVNRGFLYQPLHRGRRTLTGVFELDSKGPHIVHYKEFDPKDVVEAIQAGPRIVVNGEQVRLGNGSDYSRHSGICLDRRRRVIFYISAGFVGTTINQVQGLVTGANIGCVDTLNLDGGGSAQFFLSNNLPQAVPGLQEINIAGTDEVPVFLGLFAK